MKKPILALVIVFCFILGSCSKDNDSKVNELSLDHDLIKQTAWKGTLTVIGGKIYNIRILFITDDKGEYEAIDENGFMSAKNFKYTVEGKCLNIIYSSLLIDGYWFLTEQSEDKSRMTLKYNIHSERNEILELTKTY